MTRKFIALAALALAAVPSFATDLWDQQATFSTAGGSGEANQNFTDYPTDSSYDLNDVIVGAGGWTVNSISIEVIATNTTGVLGLTSADLNIFSNTGSDLPPAGDVPGATDPVTVSVTANPLFTNVFYVTATGLNLKLAAGEDWIGLTPAGAYATYGELYEGFTTTNAAGANYGDAWINPGGGFGQGTSWETLETAAGLTAPQFGDIDIQGTAAPEPISMSFLGLGVVGLIARRRRAVK